MNKDIKQKWVSALKSGEYEQGYGLMKNANNQYCCLGVLACIFNKEHDNRYTWDELTLFKDGNYTSNNKVPSNIVIEWGGLTNHNPILDKKEKITLAELNDRYFKSFDEIADLIEKHL